MKSFKEITEAAATGVDVRPVANEIASFFRAGRGDTIRIEKVGNGVEVEARHWGQWQVPPGEEDDGDYDWEELTPDSSKKLKTFVDGLNKKHKDLNITASVGEKNWIVIHIATKKKK